VDSDIAIVELWREMATILMLAAVGAIAGRNRGERFAYFMYAFGIWDLVYYAFLKLAIGWPASLLTWDILFLLPVPWVGPVLAPCILALTMIAFGITVVRFTSDSVEVDMLPRERVLLWLGAVVVIVSFTLDWVRFEGPTVWQNITTHRPLDYEVGGFVPVHFPWWIFVLGEGMILAALVQFQSRLSTRKRRLLSASAEPSRS
jgi:phosphoglycerol transferase MdoB-like AlkP superfamily enzyme